jgi:hypothetical protein
MVLRDLFFDVVRTLWSQKRRTALTMFGIAWGIVSIVLMVAAGEGLRVGQAKVAEGLGRDLMIVFAGRTSLQVGGTRAGRRIEFSATNIPHISAECPSCQFVMPEIGNNVLVHSNYNSGTPLVSGSYPAYEKVLPADLPKRVILDREAFQKSLRFVGLKKDDYNKNVRLFFEFPNLKVLFQHPDEGVNQGTLPFTGEEQAFELAFNIDYLTELLDRLPGEEVVYQFKDEVGQGIFMSPSIEDFSFRYILMPVRFANSATA